MDVPSSPPLSAGQFRGRRKLRDRGGENGNRISPQAAARSARSKTRSSPQAAARSARSKTRSEGARSDRSSRSATSQNSEVERAGNEWQHNTTADHCNNCECGVKFSLFTRRHHCRSCGLIFCSRCSPLRDVDDSILPYRDAKRKAKKEYRRMCDDCALELGLLDSVTQSRKVAYPSLLSEGSADASGRASAVQNEDEDEDQDEGSTMRVEDWLISGSFVHRLVLNSPNATLLPTPVRNQAPPLAHDEESDEHEQDVGGEEGVTVERNECMQEEGGWGVAWLLEKMDVFVVSCRESHAIRFQHRNRHDDTYKHI